MSDAFETAEPAYYCHICGEPLVQGTEGFSSYELSCVACQASYHVEGERATYVLPTFVEHHEPPIVVAVAALRAPVREAAP